MLLTRWNRRRKGVAATIASLLLFTTLVVASETVMSSTGASAEMARATQLETKESTTGPILIASDALWLLDGFQHYVQANPPTNCSSSGSVKQYLSSISISNSSSSEDRDGITWKVNGTVRYTNVDPAGDDNLTSLLTASYAGYSAGKVDLVAVIHVQGVGASVSYSRSETHYLHLQESVSELCTNLELTLGNLGLVAPLYSYPGAGSSLSSQWAGLIAAKQADPSVPMAAIVNPDNGPGLDPDGDFAAGIEALHEAGIAVLGYVDTDYGGIALPEIEDEMSSYLSWYHVDGVFLDDMNTSVALSAYYQTAALDARSMGLNYTMANPGAPVSGDVAADSIVEYENSGLPGPIPAAGAAEGAVIAYSVPDLPPTTWLASLHAHGVGWVWLTDQSDSYYGLPTYLGQEVQEIASLASP